MSKCVLLPKTNFTYEMHFLRQHINPKINAFKNYDMNVKDATARTPKLFGDS